MTYGFHIRKTTTYFIDDQARIGAIKRSERAVAGKEGSEKSTPIGFDDGRGQRQRLLAFS
jgi:hypothetical protein